jgi:hypothetical protein
MQLGAYMPTEAVLKMALPYDETVQLDMHGTVNYSDDNGNVFELRFCYTIHAPFTLPIPSAGTCFHSGDFIKK